MFDRGFKAWCENVSRQHRKELKLLPSDPLDPRVVAANLDVLIWTANEVPGLDADTLRILTEEDESSWSAVTIIQDDKKLIILNPTHSEGRSSSNLMHELSHLIIGHKPARVDVTEDNLLILNSYDKKQEQEADWLAGCMLLPREALLSIRKKKLSSQIAAKQYRVSEEMLRYRLNISGVNAQFKRFEKSI